MKKALSYVGIAVAALLPIVFMVVYHNIIEAWDESGTSRGGYSVVMFVSCMLCICAVLVPVIKNLSEDK